jgi:putative acetyltransferase
MSITIRFEKESDQKSIWEVTRKAFLGKPYADGDEQDLIDSLRDSGALSKSIVALDGADLIGQITFSPAAISSGLGSWYALGPVAVLPERQGEGIGGKLIEVGVSELEAMGAWGCILTGDPEYYSRHGFRFAVENCPNNEPKENFMIRTFGERAPLGIFSFHPLFYAGT